MKIPNVQKRKKRWIILTISLALLCIVVAELIACAIFAPATFDRITTPVRTAAAAVADTGEAAMESLRSWVKGLKERNDVGNADKEDPNENPQDTSEVDSQGDNASEPQELQMVSEPMIKNTAPILDPAITELIVSADTDILTGGIFPIVYYNQGDDEWVNEPYGTDYIGGFGCGPTAMAMAVRSITGDLTDPVLMAAEAVRGGHWASRSGSYLSIITGLAKDHGIDAYALEEKTPDAMLDTLLSGKLLIALMGPGHFTTGGHFILIRGVTLTGTVLVADPNSTERSLQEWDPQLILDELSSSTSHGAPLWVLDYGT